MKLADVLPLFAEFGFPNEYVRQALASGANGFEGLKIALELRWNEMNQEVGVDRLAELRPVYERLQGLKLTGVRTQADVERERIHRGAKVLDRLHAHQRAQRARNVAAVLENVEREADRRGGIAGEQLREKLRYFTRGLEEKE